MILIVKHAFELPRTLCVAVVASGLLAGCGQRGPLYLPTQPAPVSTAPAAQPNPAATNTAPASR